MSLFAETASETCATTKQSLSKKTLHVVMFYPLLCMASIMQHCMMMPEDTVFKPTHGPPLTPNPSTNMSVSRQNLKLGHMFILQPSYAFYLFFNAFHIITAHTFYTIHS